MSLSAINRLLLLTAVLALSSFLSAGEDTRTAYELLEQYDFPLGLLPKGVTGYDLDESTGKFSVYFDGSCRYKVEGYELKYESTISGVISKDHIKKLKGVSVKVLFLWLNIGEIIRHGDELEFSVGIASANFALEGFDESPQCGCGFDCVNDERGCEKGRFNRFISSLLVE